MTPDPFIPPTPLSRDPFIRVVGTLMTPDPFVCATPLSAARSMPRSSFRSRGKQLLIAVELWRFVEKIYGSALDSNTDSVVLWCQSANRESRPGASCALRKDRQISSSELAATQEPSGRATNLFSGDLAWNLRGLARTLCSRATSRSPSENPLRKSRHRTTPTG